ncbi:MAG: hypothetical protein JXA60_06665 [Candidatus Coatesbacteria bacterium]|nr:hypothetical protein [Candidatus Coatesbacteria bacterium]
MKALSWIILGFALIMVMGCADKEAREDIKKMNNNIQVLEQRVNNMNNNADLDALKSRVDNLAAQIQQMKEANQPKNYDDYNRQGAPIARELSQFFADINNNKIYKNYRLEKDLSQSNLTFYLKDKESGDLVLFGHIVYHGDKPAEWFKAYSKKRVAGYPGRTAKNQWIELLAGKFEVRVEASEERNDFQKTQKLVSFLKVIDLKGLKRYK